MSIYRLERERDANGLIDRLQGSDSVSVRRHAAQALGSFDDPEPQVLDALSRAAGADADAGVRGAAIDALDRIGPAAVERFLLDRAGVEDVGGADWARAEVFARALSAEVPEFRMAAADLLGRSDAPNVVPKLVARLEDDDDRVRASAARACGRLGHPRAVAALAGRAEDPAPRVRHAAADALGRIDAEETRRGLRRFLDDPAPDVRQTALNALGDTGDVGAVERISEALTDDHERVRRAAAFALLSTLSAAPTERSHAVRDAIVDRLNEVDDRVVAELLGEVLSEARQSSQRRNAAWLLGRVAARDDARAVEVLADALDDEDPMTAKMAATSLVEMDDESATEVLVPLVEDDHASSQARANAAFVLGHVGDDGVRTRLDDLVDRTDDQQVRKQAFAALSRLGGTAT